MFRYKRCVAVGIGCLLLALAAAGCVRAKPERVREPLPTLPVVAAVEPVTAEEAYPLPEGTPVAGQEAVATTPTAVGPTPTLEPTPTPTLTPVPTPTPYTGPLYVVAPGDTLSSIASMHGSTVQAFMEANALSNVTLRVGQELRLPPGVAPLAQPEVENTAIYVVRPGDTLAKIAAQHRMPVSQLLSLNRAIGDGSLLRPGMELTVAVNPIPEGTTVHVVQPGDTLSSIAQRYGVSMDDLARANYLTDAHRLEVGQQLVIPQ